MKKFSSQNKLLRISAAVAFFMFALGFLLLSVDFVALNKNFYKAQFAKNNAAEEAALSKTELDKVMISLIDYFSGKSDDLQIYVTFLGEDKPSPFYTADELSHMKDVKNVFRGFKTASIILLVLGIAGIACLLLFTKGGERLRALSRGAVFGCVTLFALLIIIGLCLVFFFEPLFNMFHKIFFPQGNWQFDWDSNMLAILPETLFMEAAFYIAVSGLSFALFMLISGITAWVLIKKNIIKQTPQSKPMLNNDKQQL